MSYNLFFMYNLSLSLSLCLSFYRYFPLALCLYIHSTFSSSLSPLFLRSVASSGLPSVGGRVFPSLLPTLLCLAVCCLRFSFPNFLTILFFLACLPPLLLLFLGGFARVPLLGCSFSFPSCLCCIVLACAFSFPPCLAPPPFCYLTCRLPSLGSLPHTNLGLTPVYRLLLLSTFRAAAVA